jgi:hypothetical protein
MESSGVEYLISGVPDTYTMSRDSSASIVTTLRVGRTANRDSNSDREIFLLYNVQTGSEIHPPSIAMVKVGSFLTNKVAGV